MVVTRRAEPDDIEQILDIAVAKRAQYSAYQPQFWKPADDARDRQREYFQGLLRDPGTRFAVADHGAAIRGFLVGRIVVTPPVYDPGGATCMVDDFAVADPGDWAALAPVLLADVRSWASAEGAVQLVVVTAQADDPKRAALRSTHLTAASEWWVGPIRSSSASLRG